MIDSFNKSLFAELDKIPDLADKKEWLEDLRNKVANYREQQLKEIGLGTTLISVIDFWRLQFSKMESSIEMEMTLERAIDLSNSTRFPDIKDDVDLLIKDIMKCMFEPRTVSNDKE